MSCYKHVIKSGGGNSKKYTSLDKLIRCHAKFRHFRNCALWTKVVLNAISQLTTKNVKLNERRIIASHNSIDPPGFQPILQMKICSFSERACIALRDLLIHPRKWDSAIITHLATKIRGSDLRLSLDHWINRKECFRHVFAIFQPLFYWSNDPVEGEDRGVSFITGTTTKIAGAWFSVGSIERGTKWSLVWMDQ